MLGLVSSHVFEVWVNGVLGVNKEVLGARDFGLHV